MSEWKPIETAKPQKGETVQGGWFANGHLEYTLGIQWTGDCFHGGWQPTHWKRLDAPMTEDQQFITDTLDDLRRQTTNKTEQAEWLEYMLVDSPRLRAAVARDLVARQVPLVGEVG